MSLSDPIITLLIVTSATVIGLTLKLCYSSKCSQIECCLGKITRDTTHEVAINMDTPRNITN
jgi:hypothetical protein